MEAPAKWSVEGLRNVFFQNSWNILPGSLSMKSNIFSLIVNLFKNIVDNPRVPMLSFFHRESESCQKTCPVRLLSKIRRKSKKSHATVQTAEGRAP